MYDPDSEEYKQQMTGWNMKNFKAIIDAHQESRHIDFVPLLVGYENQ